MSDIYKRLESLETLGIKFGLENIRRILTALGNPEQKYPSLLIAGTNGKGSVGAMLEAILVENGFTTGYYLSPHLIDVRERIRLNKKKISEQGFRESLSKVFRVIAELAVPATYFEALTATGLLHFAEVPVDFAVVEVGLGGRFDATNAISQQLSIITSIGLDHEAFLGKTLESIATEKAMISKPGVPMVIGNLPVDARKTVEAICAGTESPVYSLETSNIVEAELVSGFPQFHYVPWDRTIRVNLRGRHQIENAGIALLAAEQLQQSGMKLDRESIIRALNEVRWPGRLDQVPGLDPPLLLDCAHNPMGVRALSLYLDEQGWTKSIFLFTAMKDKNFYEMIQMIRHQADTLILCRVEPLERCASKQELSAAASGAGMNWVFQEDSAHALEQGLSLSKQTKLPLIAFGSIYLIGWLFSKMAPTT